MGTKISLRFKKTDFYSNKEIEKAKIYIYTI